MGRLQASACKCRSPEGSASAVGGRVMCTIGPPSSVWKDEKLRDLEDSVCCLSARKISSCDADDAKKPAVI
jgi:hypothetical protein